MFNKLIQFKDRLFANKLIRMEKTGNPHIVTVNRSSLKLCKNDGCPNPRQHGSAFCGLDCAFNDKERFAPNK